MLWTIPSSELTISLILYTLRCSFKGSRDKIHRVSQQTLRFFVWKKILGSLFFRATQLLLAQRYGTLYSVRSTIFLAIWYPGRIRTKEKWVSMKAQNSKAEISQWLKPDLRDHWIVDSKLKAFLWAKYPKLIILPYGAPFKTSRYFIYWPERLLAIAPQILR